MEYNKEQLKELLEEAFMAGVNRGWDECSNVYIGIEMTEANFDKWYNTKYDKDKNI